MGLFSLILSRLSGKGRTGKTVQDARTTVLDPFGFPGDADGSANATYMSCIDFYSRVMSKISPRITLKSTPTRDMPNLQHILEVQPNPLQNGVSFWKQFYACYFQKEVAVIWIDRDLSQVDVDRQVRNLWVIDPTSTNFRIGTAGTNATTEPVFSFVLGDRQIQCLREDLAILVRNPTVSNPFVSHSRALQQALNVIDRNFRGLEKTIATANVIRFIATSPRVMNEEDLRKRQDAVNAQLRTTDANGIFYIDGAQNIQQVNSAPGWNGTQAIEPFISQIYEYFGVSKEIVSNMAEDDQYNNWVETSVEPTTKELGIELTNQLFPRKSIATGRRVFFDTNYLFTASQSHRISAGTLLINSGRYHPNEIRRLAGVAPLPEEEDGIIERIDRVADPGEGGSQEGKEGGKDDESKQA